MSNLLTTKEAMGEFHSMLEASDDEEESMCLISYLPFDENVIRLTCGHSFNYLPLYREIVKQKKYPNASLTPYC